MFRRSVKPIHSLRTGFGLFSPIPKPARHFSSFSNRSALANKTIGQYLSARRQELGISNNISYEEQAHALLMAQAQGKIDAKKIVLTPYFTSRECADVVRNRIYPAINLKQEIQLFIAGKIPSIAEVDDAEAELAKDILERIMSNLSDQSATGFSTSTKAYINSFSCLTYKHALSNELHTYVRKAEAEFKIRKIDIKALNLDDNWLFICGKETDYINLICHDTEEEAKALEEQAKEIFWWIKKIFKSSNPEQMINQLSENESTSLKDVVNKWRVQCSQLKHVSIDNPQTRLDQVLYNMDVIIKCLESEVLEYDNSSSQFNMRF